MKKYIFLLPIMLFAHDVMFGLKEQVSPFSSIKKEKKVSIFQIVDDAKRCYNIFHNFMEINAPGEKKIKISKNSEVPFENIWKLCLDKNKQKKQKNLCKAKSVLFAYIYKKIEQLQDTFKSMLVKYLNEKVGTTRYTKNKLFSAENLKTMSFTKYIIVGEDYEGAEKISKEIEKAYKEICEYLEKVIELYKKSGNENEDSDDELNTEIFEMDLNYDDCKIKKEKKSSLKEKIKTEIINIFNDENRIENFFLEIENNAKNMAPKKKVKDGSYEATIISGFTLSLEHFENLNNKSEIKHNNSIKHSDSIVEDVFSSDILDGISGVKEIESYEKEKKPIIKK